MLTVIAAQTPALDVILSGTVQPQVQSPFGFRVMGRMVARPVKAGDRVEAGQLLAAVDPLSLEMASRSASAALASARAHYDNAVTAESRQATLLEKKTASQATFDAAEQERASAQANMAQAEANVSKAKEQLSYAVLKADYAGVVTATSAEIGQTVSAGQPILTIAEPTRRDAVIDAPTNVADVLSIGTPFKVALQLDMSVAVDGKVREIAPQADDATRTRRIRIALENPPEIFRLGSTISAWPVAGAGAGIRLPGSALLEESPQTRVFVVDPQTLKVSLRDIEVAPDLDDIWIVRGGLKPGERVVTAGVHRLKDGQIVRIDGSGAP
ncbi:efflux RND transporter periplasmic adaptor subunit [Rhodoblastus sp.]|uniref:efflux RND transporter periplasmic adaptor subunit n=1 Tax=Rhodoblastus sp. TaxID=1962975 RepID=UPI003F99ED86